jgi:hypothetical protein
MTAAESHQEGDRGLLRELIGDGRPPLTLTAIALFLSGVFAIFLAFRREFLPQDVAYLGMSAAELCAVADCNVVRFMFHDRVAFGGTLIAVAVLYAWLAAFPLRRGHRWAWWTFLLSGVLGFGSFLLYLGYGYFDSWHGAGTLALIPVFVAGLVASSPLARLHDPAWMRTEQRRRASRPTRAGRWGLLATGAGLTLAGSVIMYLGATEVFVAEDLGFMGLERSALDAINPRLVPLIAHDRAGFGGGLATTGAILLMCAWHAGPSRAFHQAVFLAGTAGFGCAIGTHFAEGYMNVIHLAPAFAGAVLFVVSVSLMMVGRGRDQAERARSG